MGCSPSKKTDAQDVDPSLLILAAVADGNTDLVRRLLATGLNPNIILQHSEHGRITPLILAVSKGNVQCTRVLINAGANLDTACGRLGTTALQQAAGAGHEDCVELLLERGAKTNFADTDGDGPLHMACVNGHVGCVVALLKHGVNVNAANGTGWTPLHLACLKGHVAVCIALRAAGANVHASDHSGLKPAAVALARGHAACIAVIAA